MFLALQLSLLENRQQVDLDAFSLAPAFASAVRKVSNTNTDDWFPRSHKTAP
jgi:hypothetical protein